MSRTLLVVLVCLGCLIVPGMFGPVQANDQGEKRGVWLALGDSYSSGEGLSGTTADHSESGLTWHGRDCQRADGRNTGAKAWAVSAFEAAGPTLGVNELVLAACTGAVSHEVQKQIFEAKDRTRVQKFDVVSFSFGGNDIGFADILKGCLDVNSVWGAFDLSPGCDIDLSSMRARVDMLVGNAARGEGYGSDINLPELYDDVAAVVKPGGHVIVVGYPHLVEEVERWDSARRVFLENCEGIRAGDVSMLRSATGYLNEQIALAVQAADNRHSASEVNFHFVDISQDPYEYSDTPSDRHGLCSETPWLNGKTLGFTSGDFRVDRSFHPNQQGHENTGRVVASLVETLPVPLPSIEIPANGSSDWASVSSAPIPEICGHGPATLVDGQIPGLFGSRGTFRLKQVIDYTGQPGVVYNLPSDTGLLTAVVVSCNAGGVAWSNPIVFFGPGPTYVTETWLGTEDVDWSALGVQGQTREGIYGLRLDGDRLLVDVETIRSGDPACCPTGGVYTVALTVSGGQVSVEGVEPTDGGGGEVTSDDGPEAVEYIHRVLKDQAPEVMHATRHVEDPGTEESQLSPFDDAVLEPAITELQRLEVTVGPLEAIADPSFESGIDGPGCAEYDYVHCSVLIVDAAGGEVAVVLIDYLGDGVTGLTVTR